jgi:hypothetical protein
MPFDSGTPFSPPAATGPYQLKDAAGDGLLYVGEGQKAAIGLALMVQV